MQVKKVMIETPSPLDLPQLCELKTFFNHPKEQVRVEALKILSQFTRDAHHRDQILKSDITRDLLPRISDTKEISEHALVCLINLSETQALRHEIMRLGAVDICMAELKNLRSKPNLVALKNSRLLVMLLANISLDDTGAKLIMSEGNMLQGLHVLRLLTWFNESTHVEGKVDTFEYVANILTNITQLSSVKTVLLEPRRKIIQSFYSQFESKSPLRKLGSWRCIRNLFMESQHHSYLLSEELGLYPRIVLPLVGSEPLDDDDRLGQPFMVLDALFPDKRRDPDPEVRRVLCDILMLCAQHDVSRLLLKRRNIYPLLRDLHVAEQDANNEELDAFLHELVPLYIKDDADLAFLRAKRQSTSSNSTKSPDAPVSAHPNDADDEPPPFVEDLEDLAPPRAANADSLEVAPPSRLAPVSSRSQPTRACVIDDDEVCSYDLICFSCLSPPCVSNANN